MIKTIVVENEKQQSDYLITLLTKHFPEVEVLKICNTAAEGIREINALQPQLLFLDVELDHSYTGFDVLEQTRSVNCEVIFTTSYNKYASRAFRFCALDFIEKPFGEEELKESISRFKNIDGTGTRKNIDAMLYNFRQTDISMQKVGVPVLGGLDFITVSEIIICRSTDNCTDFYLTGKRKLKATKTLKWVESLMQDHPFFRVHDSSLINLNHIKSYQKGGEGGMVLLTEDHEADVSRRKKESFLKVLADLKMISPR